MRNATSRWPAVLAAVMIVAGMFTIAGRAHADPQTLRWGSTTLGGGAQITIAAITATLNEADASIAVQEQITGGPVENVRLLNQGLLEIAQTTTNVAYDGYFARGKFASQGKSPMLGLFAIYPAASTLAVGLKSGIKSVADLKGKRISMGPPAAGITEIMEAWLRAYGIAESATLVKLGYTDGVNALRSGAVDATLVFGVGGKPVGFLKELDLSMDVSLVPWDIDVPAFQAVRKAHPEMAIHGIITKGTTKHTDRDIVVPTTYSAEYISDAISEERVYKLMKTLWANREKVAARANLGAWIGENKTNMLIGLHPDIPVHPGAAKLYKEIGGWDNSYKVGTVRK